MSLKKYLLIGAKYNDISSQLEKENRNIKKFEKQQKNWHGTKWFIIPFIVYYLFDSFVLNQAMFYWASNIFTELTHTPPPFDFDGNIKRKIMEIATQDMFFCISVMFKNAIVFGFIAPAISVFHDDDSLTMKEVIMLAFFMFLFLTMFVLFDKESTLIVNVLFHLVCFFFFLGSIICAIAYSYDFHKSKKNTINKKNKQLYNEIEKLKIDFENAANELINDQNGMMKLIEYIHNDDKYKADVSSSFSKPVTQSQMQKLYKKSIKNRSQEAIAKEMYQIQFNKNKILIENN